MNNESLSRSRVEVPRWFSFGCYLLKSAFGTRVEEVSNTPVVQIEEIIEGEEDDYSSPDETIDVSTGYVEEEMTEEQKVYWRLDDISQKKWELAVEDFELLVDEWETFHELDEFGGGLDEDEITRIFKQKGYKLGGIDSESLRTWLEEKFERLERKWNPRIKSQPDTEKGIHLSDEEVEEHHKESTRLTRLIRGFNKVMKPRYYAINDEIENDAVKRKLSTLKTDDDKFNFIEMKIKDADTGGRDYLATRSPNGY